MRKSFLALFILVSWAPPFGWAGVVIKEELPELHQARTLTYEGVRSREELDGGRSVTLVLPDENRLVELYPDSRSFEEKPLGAALGELARFQRAVARDARLLEETLDVRKGAGDTVAGLACTHYRFDWSARVATDRGERRYRIRADQCISNQSPALEARKAVLRHLEAVAGRFGETLAPERGEMWLFDPGRMFFGVPARKLLAAQVRIGGFPLSDEKEIDFGGMPMEPMIRGAMRERAEKQGKPVDRQTMDRRMQEMQQAMARIQSPEFQAEMQKAMRQLQDPRVQAQLRQFMNPEQMQAMQQRMGSIASGKGAVASMAEGKLRIVSHITSIRITTVAADQVSPPAGYAWRKPVFSTPENRAPDAHDGDGALSKAQIARLAEEARTGEKPKAAGRDYAPVPREAGPWMRFYREWEGVPYQWGGTTKQGVDCSGLTQNAYRAVPHIDIPRTTAQQIHAGHRVSLREVRAGDLVFFDTGFRHVGVYLAQNKFFHASSSKGVTISSLASSYWSRAFRTVVRIRR